MENKLRVYTRETKETEKAFTELFDITLNAYHEAWRAECEARDEHFDLWYKAAYQNKTGKAKWGDRYEDAEFFNTFYEWHKNREIQYREAYEARRAEIATWYE